ncbi:branched-chain amino acid ABC transporter permease [Mesorhizobium sp. LMG17149]|uniref:branched-chain amino acid ABC transporter permease n=1 Tax=unclassified Mesorhizobium TaxID=325217 RepID=UPI000FE53A1F|nr:MULTISPECIES: branched-chain amino acid ABC transporter permease [unclassified Mesorhizobium]MCQ8870856.1 branched-chain amino acid ABC transporter permease [Mesorhizobium sp. LMG17149]RWO65031.1 MAG: branched-chain amino acid ABC transporter permease [Mesorhizobium sp.]RWP07698.1 MAG: branched-chain amino acid ABC transporter permease [Mesorhizobium sp.]RWP74662.1 MAG: branched-chain amino acid ABC transporter permease [Mesorhizobium sp.]TIM23157.1 MAG: branched-chain amino acid ABC transp
MSRETIINILLALLLLAIPFSASAMGEQFYVTLATRITILALAAVGLNIALGLGGLVSFGHAAFFGLGGYAAGILATHAFNAEPLLFGLQGTTSMPVIWSVAILVCGLVALPIGAISLRTTGVYFIMITLAFAQMIYYFAISWPAYGGEDGLSIYVRNGFPGMNTAQSLTYFLICYVVLMAALGLFWLLRGSRFGAALQAARQNATRLSAVGIAPFNIRLVAFAISAMVTGLAGALFADLNRFVSPSMLSWHMSGELIVLIILGGKGRLFGPVAGAMLYVLFEFALGGFTERWQFFLGLILLGVVLFARGGLLGLLAGEARHG